MRPGVCKRWDGEENIAPNLLPKRDFFLAMLHETDPEVRHAYAQSIAALRESCPRSTRWQSKAGGYLPAEVTIFVDRFSSFAYDSQSTTEERLRRGNPERSATLWTVAYRMGPSFRGLWWAKALEKN